MESESVSQTTAIDDLIDTQMGAEPSAEPEAAPEAAQQTETVSQAASAEPPAVEAEPSKVEQAAAPVEGQAPVNPETPTPQTIRIGDRDYTPKELQDALITSQQFSHLQKKYVDTLEAMKQGQQTNQQGQQPGTSPQQMLQAIRAKYDPVVQQLAKDGFIEPDFVTLFPGMAAQMVAYREGFENLSRVVQGIGSEFMATRQREQSTGLINDIGRSINALSQSGEAFAPLQNPQQVQGFMNYLWNLNPQVMHLKNPDFLARQWVAYNKDQFLQNAQARQQQAARDNQLRLARADATTGTRAGGSMSPPPPSPLDEMVNDFLQHSS